MTVAADGAPKVRSSVLPITERVDGCETATCRMECREAEGVLVGLSSKRRGPLSMPPAAEAQGRTTQHNCQSQRLRRGNDKMLQHDSFFDSYCGGPLIRLRRGRAVGPINYTLGVEVQELSLIHI